MVDGSGIRALSDADELSVAAFGLRASQLASLAHKGYFVARGVAVSADTVAALTEEGADISPLLSGIEDILGADGLLSLRPSPEDPSWGAPLGLRNVGFTLDRLPAIAKRLGPARAEAMFTRFITDFANLVEGLDVTAFEPVRADAEDMPADGGYLVALRVYEEEAGHPFPATAGEQLSRALGAMVRDWMRPTAKILRQAKGVPDNAGLGLLIQEAIDFDGYGEAQSIDPETGLRRAFGWFRAANDGDGDASLHRQVTSTGLDPLDTDLRSQLDEGLHATENILLDAANVEFATRGQVLYILDIGTAHRSARAELQVAVDLVRTGTLTEDAAILKTDPATLTVHLHPQIAGGQVHDVVCRGIAASAGAAQGPIVFTAEAAAASAARGDKAILVRHETQPEDIRGMHTAAGVLTLTGGLTSHAAVIAQGIGVPCIVGASDLRLEGDTLKAPGGRSLSEGDILTIDGTGGWVINGALSLVQPELPEAFHTMMEWAGKVRGMGVRVNADTAIEAHVARRFGAAGIGLCRTEHMFYEEDRIDVMRQMILADEPRTRENALKRLMPMQRADFIELFEIMEGMPVTIRLLDPPLHEFLPRGKAEIKALAKVMDLEVDELTRRIDEMDEFNPMLGKRGVRLAVTMPEVYEMQARAIFEAAAVAARRTGRPVTPEIMIPLVSAHREVELVRSRIDAIARTVEGEQGFLPRYHLGVMVETPRAALRSGDLALNCSFLSFGTNDLTQMTYGLSRDDSGRFMREYVNEGVYPEDPFLTLDVEGVGELLLMAARRGRKSNPELTLGLCGEHGGDPASIRFCNVAGFDYVSCSPYRVPIARLAVAQATVLAKR